MSVDANCHEEGRAGYEPVEDMAAFDLLPERLRDALNSYSAKVSASAVLNMIRAGATEIQILDALAEAEGQI